ncbi:MAG: (Fe-S)-binding protein [Anaerolineales bacterium]|nr:(Fe-S)-binding protein [Anaerolineales bacterium]
MNRKHTDKIIKKYAEECIQCGVCLDSCSLLNNLGMTPGEIANALLENRINPEIHNAILRCSLCGLCGMDCLENLRPTELMTAAREILIDREIISVEDYQAMLMDQDWNFFTLYRDTYGISYEDLKRSQYDTLFFPGCALSSYSPELTRAAYGWLSNYQGLEPGFSDLCCGNPLSSIGMAERAKNLNRYLWQQMQSAGATRLITACPNCLYQLKSSLPGIEVLSLYELMNKSDLRLHGDEKLSVHDSCPDRYDVNIGKDVRNILSGYSLTEMEHFGQNTICCGSGGIVSIIDPDLCEERARIRMKEWEDTNTEKCVTSCMACAHRLGRASQPGNVIHVLEIIFNIKVNYAQIDRNAQAIWEGEQGEINIARLNQARIRQGLEEHVEK